MGESAVAVGTGVDVADAVTGIGAGVAGAAVGAQLTISAPKTQTIKQMYVRVRLDIFLLLVIFLAEI
jgi:hypothetical protein